MEEHKWHAVVCDNRIARRHTYDDNLPTRDQLRSRQSALTMEIKKCLDIHGGLPVIRQPYIPEREQKHVVSRKGIPIPKNRSQSCR